MTLIPENLAKYVWENWARKYGLKPEWFGKTFKAKGKEYKIVGLNTNKPKSVVQLTCNGVT